MFTQIFRTKKIVLYILLFIQTFLIVNNTYSQNSEIHLENKEQTSKSILEGTGQKATDTSDSLYVSRESFYYADVPRVTLDGTLPLNTTKIKPISVAIITGTYTGIFIMQHIVQMQTIWKEQTPFKFQEDGNYALYVDKTGHFYGCYLTSYIWSETLMYSGVSYNTSTWLGALLGLSYSSYVEILDGYGKNWGFSWSDWFSNFAGASFFVAQHHIPFLQNFTPKFMYVPAPWHGEKHRVPSVVFIDDYSSHSFWLSINVHNLLPETLKDYYPSWLELSIGYAARSLCDPTHEDAFCDERNGKQYGDNVWGSPRFMIALDYNFSKIIPDSRYGFVNWLRQSLNYFKLPSPTIEFGKQTRFYLVYPFPIRIGNVKF